MMIPIIILLLSILIVVLLCIEGNRQNQEDFEFKVRTLYPNMFRSFKDGLEEKKKAIDAN